MIMQEKFLDSVLLTLLLLVVSPYYTVNSYIYLWEIEIFTEIQHEGETLNGPHYSKFYRSAFFYL